MITPKIQRIVDILSIVADAQLPIQRGRHIAAIVYKHKIISIGQNRLKSDPFQKRWGRNNASIYLHAETSAIKNALKKMDIADLRHTTLISIRKKLSGKIGIAIPCDGCKRCIAEFGISRVICTLRDGSLIEI